MNHGPATDPAPAGPCGKIAVVGLATPRAVKPGVENGCVKCAVLWSPVDLGHAALSDVRAVAEGVLEPGSTTLEAGKLGELQVIDGGAIPLGAPYVFTTDDIAAFYQRLKILTRLPALLILSKGPQGPCRRTQPPSTLGLRGSASFDTALSGRLKDEGGDFGPLVFDV